MFMPSQKYKNRWVGCISLLFLSLTVMPAQAKSISQPDPLVVNDVTQLNPVRVGRIIRPTDTKEIVQAIKSSRGKVSIGGGRYSMGGQTVLENSLHIDMRQFNRVLNVDTKRKKVTVQAGITWRDLLDVLDKHNLSVKIMQSYANFTVGGALSVNAHGRYVNAGPVMNSVESIKLVTASGRIISASRKKNTDLFYAAIGGYGGMGVITEVTLQLAQNTRMERTSYQMPVSAYPQFFKDAVKADNQVIFHNGVLYPPEYDRVRSVSWSNTNKPLTIYDRLHRKDKNYKIRQKSVASLNSKAGKKMRQKIVDPLVFKSYPVVWRNYEASLNTKELEPYSRRFNTYALNEYFIPVSNYHHFVKRMTAVLKSNKVNVINVSIRHSPKADESYLSWANEEVFSFVIYYRQGTSEKDKQKVAAWTKQLIDIAIDEGGTYYLPYQLHASQQQFHKAYPRFNAFAAVKKKYDPTNRFSNKLWEKYYDKTVK